MRSISVMQQFTRGDKREARAARFDREAEAAQAGRTSALANLQRETALAWLDRCYQERIRDALIAQRDEARLQVEVADAAYRGGRGSQADVFSARMVVAQLDDRIVQADRLVATAINRLARWVGDAANRPLGAAPNTDVFSVDWAKFEDHVSHHPQVELLLRQEQVARAEVERAGEQALRLERRVDVQPARPVVLEHDFDQLLDSLAARSRQSAGPRARSKAGDHRSVAGAARGSHARASRGCSRAGCCNGKALATA